MVNRRVIASASAIILFLALGVAGDGGEEIFEYSARIVAELTDIDGIPIDVDLVAGKAPPGYEELVEGHTVFHTMDIIPEPPQDLTEINVEGLVRCEYQIFGVGIPSGSIDRVFVECNAGGRIFTSDPNRAAPASLAELTPTGWERIVSRPDTGALVVTTEYEYWTTEMKPDGSGLERVKAYCWETFMLDEGTNPNTGKRFNFIMALNLDRLDTEGVSRLRVQTGEDFIGAFG